MYHPCFAYSRTIRNLIVNHPLPSFVIAAYAITWSCYLLAWLFDMGVGNGFSIIGGAGPSLAAIIVSAIIRPEPSNIRPSKRLWLFGTIWTSYMTILILRRVFLSAELTIVAIKVAAIGIYPHFWALLLDILAASVVSYVISSCYSGWKGVYDLLCSLNPRVRPVRWYWFLIAVGIYPTIVLLGNFISARLGMPMLALRATGVWYLLVFNVALSFLVVMLGGGGLEEPGWRGFALPILQRRYTPIRSSIILSVVWAFWHWPLFWFGYSEGGPFGVVIYIIGVLPLAVFFTYVFNRTNGNVLIAVLLHASVNATPIFLPATTIASAIWMLLLFGTAILVWRTPFIKGDNTSPVYNGVHDIPSFGKFKW